MQNGSLLSMAHSTSIRPTARELNAMHQKFWLEQSELLNKRICDKDLYKIAMCMLESEQRMMVPVKNRKTLEGALEDAENFRRGLQRSFARKGGKTNKADALQRLISGIVSTAPDITCQQLLYKLRNLAKDGDEVVTKVDRQLEAVGDEVLRIHFQDQGKSKSTPISGLKHRLSRAKKQNKVSR
jgi:transposase